MFALVDASGMYASCEKVFNPSLRNKPVIVLSNNDGCIVACCPIAKRMSIPKFSAYFKLREELERAGVVPRSSNYELYADLSQRMMDTCARFAPEQHVYSIDETFLRYRNYVPRDDWLNHGMQIRRTVWKEVRLPVGVGFGPTLTLAKAANHASKKIEGYRGVAVIESEPEREYILRNMKTSDVWGIGRRISQRLALQGIESAWQLANAKPELMKKEFSILVANTVHELNAQPRFEWDQVQSPKKQIYSTRSFGQRVTRLVDLRQALVTHVGIAAQKLRRQNSLTCNLLVFAHNSIHDKEAFFRRSALHTFTIPTSDTGVMAKAASELAHQIFTEGVRYYKAGVGLLDISEAKPMQTDLFFQSADRPELMACLDSINSRYGRDTLHIAGQGIQQKFSMRRELLSPRYTTRLSDIPLIQC